jgi:hypothetical protein
VAQRYPHQHTLEVFVLARERWAAMQAAGDA